MCSSVSILIRTTGVENVYSVFVAVLVVGCCCVIGHISIDSRESDVAAFTVEDERNVPVSIVAVAMLIKAAMYNPKVLRLVYLVVGVLRIGVLIPGSAGLLIISLQENVELLA